jgi:hypothetical protein
MNSHDIALAIMSWIEQAYSAKDSFVAFVYPSIPMSADDLSFALPADKSHLSPQEALSASADFARIANLIPKCTGIWSPDGRLLWDEYQLVLLRALVASQDLPPAQKAEAEAARSLLYTRDAHGEQHASPKLTAYWSGQRAYIEAKLEYDRRRTAAQSSSDANVRKSWENEEASYKAKVDRAYQCWMVEGYKSEIDEAFADLERLGRDNPQVMWSQLTDDFKRARRADLNDQDFYVTTIWPDDAFGGTDWTRVDLAADQLHSLAARASSAVRHRVQQDGATPAAVKYVSGEVGRVEIVRPWFNATLLTGKWWRLPAGDEPLSDGGDPPAGRVTAYTCSMLLIRRLKVTESPTTPSLGPKVLRIGPFLRASSGARLSAGGGVLAPGVPRRFARGLALLPPPATSTTIGFSSFPDGTSVTFVDYPCEQLYEGHLERYFVSGRLLIGDEWKAKGIHLSALPSNAGYDDEVTAVAIAPAGWQPYLPFPTLTSANPNGIDQSGSSIEISFARPLQTVTVTFVGAHVSYELVGYDVNGAFVGRSIAVGATPGLSSITLRSTRNDLKRVVFGDQHHGRAGKYIKEIRLEPSLDEPSPTDQDDGDGMQLVAFICKKVPKTPDPDERLHYS